MALGPTLGYDTWPLTGWNHPSVISWSKHRLGMPQLQWIVGSCDKWESLQFLEATDKSLVVPLCQSIGYHSGCALIM